MFYHACVFDLTNLTTSDVKVSHFLCAFEEHTWVYTEDMRFGGKTEECC